ncbi:MAG TPA: MarR family transcriptional regulator [Candidatus Blautia excrementipullorum]|nr:MarR family transcriptional regulator [Candidatus Blautia excrementipullorum]
MESNRDYIDRLNLCMNRIDGLYYMAARKMGIKDNALALFYVLNDGKLHTQKEICDEWLIPRTTINTIVKECADKGYLVMDSHEHTKEKQIRLTGEGKAYVDRLFCNLYKAEENAMDKTMREYSPELLKGLEAFTNHLIEEFQKEIFDKGGNEK